MAITDTTSKPIPSSDADVLDLNAKNFDVFSNSEVLSYNDRGGIERKTLSGHDAYIKQRLERQLLEYGGFTSTGPYQPSGFSYTINMLFDESDTTYLVIKDFVSTDFATDSAINPSLFTVQQGYSKTQSLLDFTLSKPTLSDLKVRCELLIDDGLMDDNAIVQSIEYFSGSGGGNQYFIKKAVDNASRPTEDDGAIIYLSTSVSDGWYLQGVFNKGVSVSQFGAIGSGDESSKITNCDNYCNVNNEEIIFDVTVNVSNITVNAKILDTTNQIFTSDSTVTINNGHVRPEWFGDIEGSILKAIDALPASGGRVLLKGVYKPNHTNNTTNYISKSNVELIGESLPVYNSNLTSLENGTIIQGRLNVFADNFHHENIGYDLGKNVVDTYWNGADPNSATAIDGSTWDAFIFSVPNSDPANGIKKNYSEHNIIALNYAPSAVGHSLLREGIDGVKITGVSCGVFGNYSNVIKASNVTFETLEGYANSSRCAYIKSDSYAPANFGMGDKIKTGRSYPLVTSPWTPYVDTSVGTLLEASSETQEKINIGTITDRGNAEVLAIGGASQVQNEINIGILDFDGFGGSCINGFRYDTGAQLSRVIIGTINGANATQAVNVNRGIAVTQADLTIGSITATNCTTGISAGGFSKVNVGTYAGSEITNAYSIADAAIVKVGIEDFSATNRYTSDFSFGTGWQQFAGNSDVKLELKGGSVNLNGLAQNTGSGVANVLTLPSWARPNKARRFVCWAYGSGAINSTVFVSVNSDGSVMIDTGLAAASEWISLDGMTWNVIN